MSEEQKTYKCSEVMKTCKYRVWLSGDYACGYILETEKRRGCDPEQCSRYIEDLDKANRKVRDWAKGTHV